MGTKAGVFIAKLTIRFGDCLILGLLTRFGLQMANASSTMIDRIMFSNLSQLMETG